MANPITVRVDINEPDALFALRNLLQALQTNHFSTISNAKKN